MALKGQEIDFFLKMKFLSHPWNFDQIGPTICVLNFTLSFSFNLINFSIYVSNKILRN